MRHLFLVLLMTFSTAAGSVESYGIHEAEQWVFAISRLERLRFEIDKRWYGKVKVPQTYFHERVHKRTVKTGLVDQKFIESWLACNNKSELKRY